VPATPDPYDDATSEAHRLAVMELLPPRSTPADTETADEAPEELPETIAGAEPVPAES
jgi:hypothetical protein